jgi:glycosyltransferase involved in cell wall biosynthesis
MSEQKESSTELTNLDLAFYREWHADLSNLPEDSLKYHWDTYGLKEGREPSFAALLKTRELDGNQIPADFSPNNYLRLNSHLESLGITNRWTATLHYLSSKVKADYHFDHEFYTTYYRDLALHTDDPLDHFVKFGRDEGRIKTSSEYWTRSKSNTPELDNMIDVERFIAANPDLVNSEYLATKWNITDYLIEKGIHQARPISADKIHSADVYYCLGNGLAAKGNTHLAEKAYLAACTLDTKHANALQHLADLCLNERRFVEAITYYQLSLAIAEPSINKFWGHYNLSVSLDAVGEHASSIEHLSRARRIDINMHHARERHEQSIRREWEKLDLQARASIAVGRINDAEALYQRADALIATLFIDQAAPPRYIGEKPSVALVVDPFLPQCVRYRVTQKLEQFNLLGWQTSVLEWPKIEKDSFRALAFADIVVFYRTPALFDIAYLMKKCRHAGKVIVYEIDDLVFDSELYPEPLASYGGLIEAADHRNLIRGTILFQTSLRAADYALASTALLAAHMSPLTRTEKSYIHRNGLDSHTAKLLELPRKARNASPIIFYGTGTKAHNADFDDLVAPALTRILAEFPSWRLMIAGYLTLPANLLVYEDRIVRVGFISDVDTYLSVLAKAEINIAVLHKNEVNDSKSELKWFEAGAYGIASVVSPTANYLDVTDPGHDVLVAATPEEWYQQLKKLIIDPVLCRTIGENARSAAKRYAPSPQSHALSNVFQQIGSDWNTHLAPIKPRQKIVIVNVFFPPQSIGGATRVVEDNVQIMLERYSEKFDVEVFTSDHGNPVPYVVNQYGWKGVRVTKVSTPQKAGMDWDYKNNEIGKIFEEYLDQVQPSLVHFHCVQRLTASVVEATKTRKIPYLITAHDAWWISDFQFLVDESGKLCDLRQNDIGVLISQSKDIASTLSRQSYLRDIIDGAQAVLPVSSAFAEIYIKNDISNIQVVRNGVMPHIWFTRSKSTHGRVRIAHIGGMSNHKGYHLFCAALASHNFENIEAVVVDLSKEANHTKKGMIGNVPVTYIGRVDHSDIAALYSKFDVLAAPSIWPESFGLVTREAVAAGCWVIASDIGAIGEDLIPNENGFRVRAGDLGSLKAVFREINENPLRYLGENRNREVRQVTEQVAELAEIYSKFYRED